MVSTIYTRVDQLTVTTTVLVVSENQKRNGIYLKNVGTTTISLSFSDNIAATALYGVVLEPGDTVQDFTQLPYRCWDGKITAISSAAGGKLSVYER